MNPTDEIRKKIDIVEFIGSFITLKKAGRNFKANCPFHQEKTPSFIISPERQIWHCFGACQEGGDTIKFLMKWENITFSEALQELAKRAGVRLAKYAVEDAQWKKKDRLIGINMLASEFFHYVLTKTDIGKKARDYLRKRLVKNSTLRVFSLGYAPQSWDSLTKFLLKKQFSQDESVDVGLAIRGSGGSVHDRFRGRIMFPIKDQRGNIIGFSGRTLDLGDSEGAKYVNTPETYLYRKRESLYGIDIAKDAIKKQNDVFLVEGEFDVISSYQAGIINAAAIKGSSVTRDQLLLLKRYTNKITLSLDTDEAGREAVRRGISEAEDLDIDMNVVVFDFAKDPDEAVRKDPIMFKKSIKKAVPVYDYMISYVQKKFDIKEPFHKKRIGEELVPLIGTIKNPIVQSHYVKKIAELLNVNETSIERSITRAKYAKIKYVKKIPAGKVDDEEPREIKIQKYALSLVLQSSNVSKTLRKFSTIVGPDDFSIPSYAHLLKELVIYEKEASDKFNQDAFISRLNNQLRSVFDELFLYASYDEEVLTETLEKLAYEIKKYAIKRNIAKQTKGEKDLTKQQKEALKMLSGSLKEVEKSLLSL